MRTALISNPYCILCYGCVSVFYGHVMCHLYLNKKLLLLGLKDKEYIFHSVTFIADVTFQNAETSFHCSHLERLQ